MQHPREWVKVTNNGLCCPAANLFIDPLEPVERAVVTHGHADHARPGHNEIIATTATLDIMQVRYNKAMTGQNVALEYGQSIKLGEPSDPVELTLLPAGHILGSSQVRLVHRDHTLIISGDYKRSPDPTCPPFEPHPCDVFVTEATFALPVFRHPPILDEVQKLLVSLRQFPNRCHLVGTYALGKCQRVMLALRELGYDKPLYLHGALVNLCRLYEQHGHDLGQWIAVNDVADRKSLAGEIVLAPPSALADRWSRSLPDVRTAMASGWMQIRARSKQRRAELPIIISDHCDWPELLQTIEDVNPGEVWVTHGREDALVYQAQKMGYQAQALSLVGYEDDEETG